MDNFELLKKLLTEKVKHPENITLEATMKDLGIDSLDLVDIMLEAESQLNITFEDDELLDLKTVSDAVNLLDAKTGKKEGKSC